MDKGAVKDLIFGGLQELSRNRNYYSHSSVGEKYSYWTEDGKAALQEYMQVMTWKLKQAEEEELDKRSKDMVMNALKGKNLDGSKSN